jgi:hypothetical protein
MSMNFTKLFSSITESTVWQEPDHVRLAWICLLAMADRRGRIWSSIPGLANRARITVDQAEDAIKRFLSPDIYSRTPDHEGRRIEPIDGGWRLLNHAKYRALRDDEEKRLKDAERQQRYRENKKRNSHGMSRSVTQNHANAEADSEAEAESLLNNNKERKAVKKFQKPTLEEMRGYGLEIGLSNAECDRWFDRQETIGWVVVAGKVTTPMKDWKASMRTWKRNKEEWSAGSPKQSVPRGTPAANSVFQIDSQIRTAKDRIKSLKDNHKTVPFKGQYGVTCYKLSEEHQSEVKRLEEFIEQKQREKTSIS